MKGGEKKIILVTGGNRGIGLEICRQLAAEGHTVLVGCRNLNSGKSAIRGLKGALFVVVVDVSFQASMQKVRMDLRDEYGRLDVLVNNAGIISSGLGTVDAPFPEIENVMTTNFYGPWYLSREMMPLLRKSAEGRIINVSSGMGAVSDLSGNYAGYRMSKYALNGMTMMMANDLRGEGIKVNAMCPGWVRTDMGGAGATRSVEQGADTAVWLATAAEIPTGKFFRDRAVIPLLRGGGFFGQILALIQLLSIKSVSFLSSDVILIGALSDD
ncbi:MAG: SDR family NAD(P)-dependent oxidoreductase [Bacteroidota bacterium]